MYLVELLAVRSDYSLVAEDAVLADVITNVATGDISYDELVEWFKKRLVRFQQSNSFRNHPSFSCDEKRTVTFS